jgi:hypothetical protein
MCVPFNLEIDRYIPFNIKIDRCIHFRDGYLVWEEVEEEESIVDNINKYM